MGVGGVVVQPPAGAMERLGEWIASRPTGQLVVRGVDSVLRLIEKSLMWSTQTGQRRVSSSDAGVENSDSRLVVVARPLSWPLFLPLRGVLGVVRVTVYYVTRVFRKPRDTSDMINWLQSKRRRLRAVKFAGLKNMRLKQSEGRPDRTPNGTPCVKATTPDHERKRKYEDVEQSDWTDYSDDEDESVAVKLEKCDQDYDSETDPDFVPDCDHDSSEDEGSAASGDEDIEDEEGAVLVNGVDVPVSNVPASPSTPRVPVSPSIVTVESPESPKLMQNLQPALEVV